MAKDYENHDVAFREDDVISEQEQEKQLGFSMLAKLALAVAVTASLVISIICLMQFNRLKEERDELQKQIDYYNEKIGRLQYYINKDVDDEYIAEYAREQLGFYYPDEEIYYNDDKK